jgi:hypothetical protein
MSDWKAGFHKAMIDALIRNGTPINPEKASFYGYIADDWQGIVDRVKRVGVDYACSTYEDAEWHEFKGTFYEGDTRTVGVDVHLVLEDGSTADYRWEGNVGELMHDVANS